ncbi:MAG TPA: hypothetical protein PLP16_10765 [Smithellaceae bacterium]|nr:hypothetical protein [Smithellaceae bacterium]
MKNKLLFTSVLCLFLLTPITVFAAMLEFRGEGKAPINPDNNAATVMAAKNNAKRNAVNVAIRKLIGPSATNDPKVKEAIENIIPQIDDSKIISKPSKDAENNYVLNITIKIDDLEFRQLLQTEGIAPTGDRTSKVLALMDEYHTTPTDMQKPLKEVIEYSHDKTATSEASLSAASGASSETKASSREASASSANYAAKGQYGAHASGYGYSAGGYASGQVAASGAQRSQSSADYSDKSSESASLDTKSFEQQKNVVNFKKLVEYQPRNVGPAKSNATYNELLNMAGQYDLNFMNSTVFRSKYFPNKAVTLDDLANGPELDKYVQLARKEGAEYFMMGNAIMRDLGHNQCDGDVTISAYSVDDNTSLTATTHNESARGTSPDDCRVTLAKKLAYFVGKTIGHSIKNYSRQREVSGKEYRIRLISSTNGLGGRMASSFSKNLSNLKGLNSKLNVRTTTESTYEVDLTYKGEVPFSDAVTQVLDAMPAMNQADFEVIGTTVTICLEGKNRCK